MIGVLFYAVRQFPKTRRCRMLIGGRHISRSHGDPAFLTFGGHFSGNWCDDSFVWDLGCFSMEL